MADAQMQRHADHFLRVAGRHPQCRRAAIIEATANGARLELELEVAVPTAVQAKGVSDTGVRTRETVEVQISGKYPWASPRFSLRADFPRDLPHLTPGSEHERPTPCLVDGFLDEFFNHHGLLEFGVLFIIEQMAIWLGRAAHGTLSNPEHGWEPVMRQSTGQDIIADGAFARSQVTARAGSVCLETDFVHFGSPEAPLGEKDSFLVTRNSFAPIVKGLRAIPFVSGTFRNGTPGGKTVTLVCWPAAGHVSDRILPETVTTIEELATRADDVGCGAPFRAFLQQVEARLKDKAIAASFPVGVILCARRPYALMNRASDIELLPYLFEIAPRQNRKSLFGGVSGRRVEAARLLDLTTPALLREVSAAPTLGAFSLIGCGSVGSKCALHLARAGGDLLALTDKGVLLPHNMARHALVRAPIPASKAHELASELAELGQNPKVWTADALEALQDPDHRRALAPAGTAVLLNTTASLLLRDALSLVSPADIPGRMAEIALFGRGRGAFLFFEGPGRNPNLGDLLSTLSAEATRSECALLFDPRNGLVQVQIGEGCGSLTMPMTDARLSAMTASATEELMRLASTMPADGEIVLGIKDEAGPSTYWRRVQVPPFIEVPVEGADWKLRISSKVDAAIRQDLAQHGRVETGGLLIGTCNSRTKTITVVDTLPAPMDSVRTPSLFVLGTAGLARATMRRHRESGGSLADVGTWHSHLTNQGPSPTDRKTAADLANERPPPAVLLIALPDGYCSIIHRRPE
ncbi:Mov34/MPN/PAD-1 family protein [Mesorhizobium abyssinicae]|uniref:Mov34/MPN/PAD-1 family protein n=1 Tax=Mesorhizobium abyssinicae TaxID=1209958 RepID=A0ABU5ATZ1_9HYPH|nr:Mov34/MPN/PAD-1 family protein [Mesorhizobium abyssinicae]MDX8540781.1 Mov34/MPN/PAD-1 family protein [Mesorhizobium abyssinicae]